MARFSIIETPQNLPFFDGVVGGGCKNMPDFPWGMTFFWRGVLKIEGGGEYTIFASKMYQIFHDFISTKKNLLFLANSQKEKKSTLFFSEKETFAFSLEYFKFFYLKVGVFSQKNVPHFWNKNEFLVKSCPLPSILPPPSPCKNTIRCSRSTTRIMLNF